MTPAQLNDVVKTQQIRLLDVFLIGPLMIWGGMAVAGKNPRRCRLAGGALAFFGISTILFNANNWRRIEDAQAGK